MGVSIVVKDHFLYHQARVSAGLLPSGAAVLCSNSMHSLLPCVQRLKEQTTLRISKCHQQCISCRLHGLELVCVCVCVCVRGGRDVLSSLSIGASFDVVMR
jgi:hypothetical protein